MFSFNKNLKDDAIVQGILAGGTQRRLFENKLYEKFYYLVRDAQFKHKISADDAQSAYSDAILGVIDHVVSGRFEGRSELKTYLFQIFTNKCVDIIRKNTTNKSEVHQNSVGLEDALAWLPDEAQSVVRKLIAESEVEQLRKHLRQLGEKCREMIMAWGEGYSDDEIAQMMAYNTAAVAKTSRQRCLEKLKEKYSPPTPDGGAFNSPTGG
ncbi:MAG: RNA polymerase sigma factor [Runella slithyformis]|nr:MAG: RNA polymerase sigma factor [Runella slithyformis]TAF48534.1 MAG: RNA polymerase sigma factor [Runella slithyformis]TAF83332.1 MAG: RNA polymerase sigma factor [Runella slithyformis]